MMSYFAIIVKPESEGTMKTITVRNIPDDVALMLKGMAETSAASINSTVLKVLADGVLPRKTKRRKNDFSRYCGGWSQKEFDDFEAAVADCGRIDPENWK